jgi:hypothetical protein
MGSSNGKNSKDNRRRSSSITTKGTDSKLSMLTEINPEEFEMKNNATSKKLAVVPSRKHSE